MKPKTYEKIMKCAAKSTSLSLSSNLHCHPQHPSYCTAIVEPTINLIAPPKTFSKPANHNPNILVRDIY